MKLPKRIYIEIDAFRIAQIGQYGLYELADQALQKAGIYNVEIIDMDLKPVSIVKGTDEVKYKCIINRFNINQ